MKINLLTFFLSVLTATAFAQNTTLSPYSYFGTGQPIASRTAENNSMGGITTYADSTHFSLDNPATLGKLEFVQYRVGAGYKIAQQQSQQSSATTSISSINYLALSVPTKHFAFSFGLRPKSSVGYRITSTETVNDLEQERAYTGTGGVNSTFFGVGITPVEGLSLGFSANYNFGYTEKTITQGITGIQYDTRKFTRSELSGIHYTLGMHYQKSIFSDYQLQLSAVYTPSANLESTNSRILSTISPTGIIESVQEIDLKTLAKTTNRLPAETTLGVGFGKPQLWYFGATYLTSSQGVTHPLETNADVVYESTSRFSVGGFYIPKYDSFTNYLSRMVYRVGVRWEHTGLALKNQAIKDFGITFGLGLPLGVLSKVNIGVDMGGLGTTDAGLIKEKYTNIMLGFSLSDVWFIKRKYD